MKLSRRALFRALLFARPVRVNSLEVEVLETFDLDGRSVAILAHHTDEVSRQNFATWLQANPKTTAHVRTRANFETQASVFRVRMCFGRALILPQGPIQTHRGELLILLT